MKFLSWPWSSFFHISVSHNWTTARKWGTTTRACSTEKKIEFILETPLLLEEPHFVIVRREQLEEDL